ncbi:hypothetical protein [Ruminococcus sp.]|uniref:hypothetical protein n=1 Tax=Ruminococcus sp. TaxID=41978 RepID=UPI0025CF9611|nr:hypothetical protein [Ruminococcus sp.]MBQ8965560.1 hypothetical protein [Ruminococcus sp.]
MGFLEKYRNYDLISKVMAGVLFLDAGTSILKMFINMIRYDIGFSIWVFIYQSFVVIAGLIFLLKKHQDKIFKFALAGTLIIAKLVSLIRTIIGYNPGFKVILSSLFTLVLSVAFAAYYLGIVRPAGRKFFLMAMYAITGVASLFTIFSIGSVSFDTFAVLAVLALYGYQETRAQGNEANFVYAGMIGVAYLAVYQVLYDLLSLFGVFLPSFFYYVKLILCLAMPLLVYDRIVPGEGQAFALDFSVFTGAPAPSQYAQPMQQNFRQQPVQPQQNNFDPMTGQPLNPQPQQNNFDPMTGQPLNPQPRQNNFDPMTGQPLNNNNNDQN